MAVLGMMYQCVLSYWGNQAPFWAVCFHSGPRLVVLLRKDYWVTCRLAQNWEEFRDI